MKLTLALAALVTLACAIATIPATIAPATVVPPVVSRPMRVILPTAIPQAHTCRVTADVLTVRACGGVECQAVDWLERGEVVTTTQVITGWVWTGAGWINSVFCKEQK